MTYYVRVQERDMPWKLSLLFSQQDRDSLLSATVGESVSLEKGTAILFKDGAIILSLRNRTGIRHYPIDFNDLCDQLTEASD
jgi:uncharacterized protein VirK/YbjX